jgi:hypothetical protein
MADVSLPCPACNAQVVFTVEQPVPVNLPVVSMLVVQHETMKLCAGCMNTLLLTLRGLTPQGLAFAAAVVQKKEKSLITLPGGRG